MPLEDLLAALERDTDREAEALLAEARAAAAEITTASNARRERRRREVAGLREAELRRAAAAALGDVRRAGRRAVLEARARLLDRVFAAARAMFPAALAGEEYRAGLPRHVAEAGACLGDEPAVIRCPPALLGALQAMVGNMKRLSVEGDESVGPGFRIATTDGAIEVDNTLDGRLERQRPVLAIAVLERLHARR